MNQRQGITTESGIDIVIHDGDEKKIEIKMPSEEKNKMNAVIIVPQSITIADEAHGNTVMMDKSGITIKSAKDIRIEGNKVKITGKEIDINKMKVK